MNSAPQIALFGEVLFDIFPKGEKILGGAPFNVAWNLQALGDTPLFISRVGQDPCGSDILQAMREWDMQTTGIQVDAMHATGRVQVEIIANEPRYQIVPDCAYDFIDANQIPVLDHRSVLYHGTLGLRQTGSRKALEDLRNSADVSIFLDVNLRDPWWRQQEVENWLSAARWVKLNHDELHAMGFEAENPDIALKAFQDRFQVEQAILTCGKDGAMVRTLSGELYQQEVDPVAHFVDTVGAGDAFSAVYLHGLRAGWNISETLGMAQRFAGKVIGLRGATTTDKTFYQQFLETCHRPCSPGNHHP